MKERSERSSAASRGPRDRRAGVPWRHRCHRAEGLTHGGAGGAPGAARGGNLSKSVAKKVIQRGHGGALLLGPLKCRWTTCVRLDHLNAVGPPGSRNTVVQRNASGPTAFKWSKRAGRVTTCETPSHHAGRAVGAERERGAPESPPLHPVRPRRPARRSHRARPPDAPGGDPSRPSPTTFTLHVFKTTPE